LTGIQILVNLVNAQAMTALEGAHGAMGALDNIPGKGAVRRIFGNSDRGFQFDLVPLQQDRFADDARDVARHQGRAVAFGAAFQNYCSGPVVSGDWR